MCNRWARKNELNNRDENLRGQKLRPGNPARSFNSSRCPVRSGAAGPASRETRTNLAGSVTSESMTALWVARDRGLFKKYGLDMQFILMPRNPLAVAALLAGEIDAAIVGPGHVINAASSGADLIGIANLKQKLDYRLNGRPEIKKKEDLRGKRIAISGPGSTSHLQALLALQDFNVDPTQAKITFLTIPEQK